MGVQLPSEPITRKEQYLAKAAGQAVEVPAEPITREEAYLNAIAQGGGGGGTSDYDNLSNQPQVNGETLIGDKTGADLGLVDAEEGKGLSTNDYDDNEKAAVAAATSAISAMKDGTDLDSFGDVEVALLDKADTADLGTAAAKDSTNAVIAGSTDLVESGAVKDAIDVAVAAAYHHAGTKTVAQLTHDLLVAANEGNVYNITDSGTTTSDFIEGIGKTIDEGSNVGICKVGNAYMFDLLSGFVDTINFVQKSQTSGLLKNDGTVNDEIEDDVDQLKNDLTNYQAQNDLNLEVPNRKNLIDSSAYSNGYFTSEGVLTENQYYYATDYIKVEPNTDYVVSGFTGGGAYFVYYNASKTVLSTVADTTTIFKTPANTAFVRLSIKRDGMTNPQMELGSTATAYAPYIPSVNSRLQTVESGDYKVIASVTSDGVKTISELFGSLFQYIIGISKRYKILYNQGAYSINQKGHNHSSFSRTINYNGVVSIVAIDIRSDGTADYKTININADGTVTVKDSSSDVITSGAEIQLVV